MLAADRHFTEGFGSVREALLAVVVSLMALTGENLSAASLVQGLGDAVRMLRDRGASADDLSAALPPALSSWDLGHLATEVSLPTLNRPVLAGYDASAPRPRRLQRVLTKLALRARFVLSRRLSMRYQKWATPQWKMTCTGGCRHETSRRRTIGASVVPGRWLVYGHSLLNPFGSSLLLDLLLWSKGFWRWSPSSLPNTLVAIPCTLIRATENYASGRT